MDINSKIYVAGHRGMVGAAIVRQLKKQGYNNLLLKTHSELDLCRQAEVEEFFKTEKPEYVFLAAAKVGGIIANKLHPADFMYSNMILEMNVIHSAWKNGCKKLLFLGSSCIYPRLAPQPMQEECLLPSSLEPTHASYSLATISGLRYFQYLNRQYGTDYISVMPTNLYGPGDNYHPEHSHVLPALIRRFHEAKEAGAKEVICWGDGSPLREFLYVDDLAELCVLLMNTYSAKADYGSGIGISPEAPENDQNSKENQHSRELARKSDKGSEGEWLAETVNAGTGKEITIKALTELVAEVVGYKGAIKWDTTRPNGTPRKLLDVSKSKALGWEAKTQLREGIVLAYNDFLTSEVRAER